MVPGVGGGSCDGVHLSGGSEDVALQVIQKPLEPFLLRKRARFAVDEQVPSASDELELLEVAHLQAKNVKQVEVEDRLPEIAARSGVHGVQADASDQIGIVMVPPILEAVEVAPWGEPFVGPQRIVLQQVLPVGDRRCAQPFWAFIRVSFFIVYARCVSRLLKPRAAPIVTQWYAAG